MNKTIYRTVWRQQEVEFKDMDWDAFVSNTFNYLCDINDRNFIEVDQEFILRSEAEKYIKEHPVCIKRLPDCFFIRWLELHEVVFTEDDCEAGFDLLGASGFAAVFKLDLMNIPAESVGNFDLNSVPVEVIKDLLQD